MKKLGFFLVMLSASVLFMGCGEGDKKKTKEGDKAKAADTDKGGDMDTDKDKDKAPE